MEFNLHMNIKKLEYNDPYSLSIYLEKLIEGQILISDQSRYILQENNVILTSYLNFYKFGKLRFILFLN